MSSSLRSVSPRRSTAVGVFLLLKHFVFAPLEVRGGIKSNLTDSTLLRRLHIQEVTGSNAEARRGGSQRGAAAAHLASGGASPADSPRPTAEYHESDVLFFPSAW